MELNLEKQLLFYGAYHHNPVNVAIHIICVPMILMTSLLFATNTPDAPLPMSFSKYFPVNLGTITSTVYATLYILMEPVAGALIAPLLVGGTLYANSLTNSSYSTTANYIALGIFVASWIAQFIGHGMFEGRAPALLDNLVQALFLAPFFVWLEILFSIGYRPELKRKLDKQIETEIANFNKSNAKKSPKSSKASTKAVK